MTAVPTDEPAGDDRLFARVYSELKTLAKREMSGERADHTLQATALVSEVWLRLRDQVGEVRDNPGRFYFAAAESMRRILIDHARSRGRKKRGGAEPFGETPVSCTVKGGRAQPRASGDRLSRHDGAPRRMFASALGGRSQEDDRRCAGLGLGPVSQATHSGLQPDLITRPRRES